MKDSTLGLSRTLVLHSNTKADIAYNATLLDECVGWFE